MLCTVSSHFVFDLGRRPFYGCAGRLLFVQKETPGTRLTCRSHTCYCKKSSDWLERLMEAQHNI